VVVKCSGVDVSGHRKGEPCGGIGKYMLRGKSYCAAHRSIAQKEPKRFQEATECWEKAQIRRIRKERQAEALKNTQVDAFPTHGMHSESP
jgi:hypothetical protein